MFQLQVPTPGLLGNAGVEKLRPSPDMYTVLFSLGLQRPDETVTTKQGNYSCSLVLSLAKRKLSWPSPFR